LSVSAFVTHSPVLGNQRTLVSAQEIELMKIVGFIKGLLLAGWLLVWPITGEVQAARESYALGYEVIGQTERVLKQAALNSPKWHAIQDSIQRDVHDIAFLLEQALRAAEKSNEVASKDYAHQALTLLQRAVTRGHFDPEKIKPVLTLIRQLLPNVPV
jgi:hypothetical protein